jgi:macrolide transport system ATP-binding/permease protein
MALLQLRGVGRTFSGAVEVTALDDVALDIEAGEFFAIMGPSGGGKSTLLNTIGLLDHPTTGTYTIAGDDIGGSTSRRLAETRSEMFGFVFQGFHLLDQRPVRDSVELGLLYRAVPTAERRVLVDDALARVGLDGLGDQLAAKLSGGQRQRVAIARALAAGTPVIVADEPTGNLDSENGARVVETLLALRDAGTTVVLVTHDPTVARAADRVAHLRDGRIESVGPGEPVGPVPVEPSSVGAVAAGGVALSTGVTGVTGTTRASSARHATSPGGAGRRPDRPGRPSRLRFRDLAADALRSVTSRLGKTAGLVAAVAVAVALAVASLGLSVSARAQVGDTFDLHTNRDVGVSWDSPVDPTAEGEAPGAIGGGAVVAPFGSPEAAADIGGRLDRVAALSGVESVGALHERGSAVVRATTVRDALQAPVVSIEGDLLRAARVDVDWLARHGPTLGDREVLIGRGLAAQLPLGPLAAAPVVSLGDTEVAVVGIVDDSPRVPSLVGAVTTGAHSLAGAENPSQTSVLIRTGAGAAQQVARQAPLAIDPVAAETFRIDAPIDPTTLRAEIESDVASTLLAFTGVALLAAVAGLGNSMVLAVLERRKEFGLRRALGARPGHIAGLVLAESVVIGALGGLLGLALGLGAVLVMTIARQWIPVFDLRLAPAALVGGVVVGAAGGLAAAWRASRIEPHEALRL